MSAASWGSLTSQGSLPRAAKSSTQRSPERASCCPVATVSRQKPKRRSAAGGLPPQRASATSAWKSRRWWPLRRRAAERIRPSYNFTEASIAVPPEVGGITTLGLGIWPGGYRVGFHSPVALLNHHHLDATCFRAPVDHVDDGGSFLKILQILDRLDHRTFFL